nr:hypothetical protein [Bacillus wiedmannii]
MDMLLGGIGRTFGYLSHFNVGKRVFQKGYKPVVRQLKSNYERFKKNPIKQIKRHPGARLDGMKRAKKQREKAFKNSTTAKLMKISNAVGRR